jgi:uncharacterized membrane protein
MYRYIIALVLISNSANAGAKEGSWSHKDTVSGYTTQVYKSIVYVANKQAIVLVRGDGSSDLDCEVYDSSGDMVDWDYRDGDNCSLRWTPEWTGKFTIKIINHGKNDNEYWIGST